MNKQEQRFTAAVAAMQGLSAHISFPGKQIAKTAVRYADELLAELDRTKPNPTAELEALSGSVDSRDGWIPDDDGWIEWSGGPCPVDVPVQVETREFGISTFTDPMSCWWLHDGGAMDILRYRIPK